MKAIVFAAGLGSRLKPFTDTMPKALVPVNGEPMLGRVIGKLKRAGVSSVVVNVHHFADSIEEYLRDNNNFGIDIHVSDERGLLLDTGGGILAARELLDDGSGEAVIAHNADILTDFSVDELIAAHRDGKADVTFMTAVRDSSRQIYFRDGSGVLAGWQNLKSGEVRPGGFDPSASGLSARAFGGVHVFSPAVFPLLEEYSRSQGPVFSVMPFYLDNLNRLTIKSFTPGSPFRWHDIGSPEKLRAAEAAFSES